MTITLGGTNPAVTFPDGTIQNTAFTTGAVTQSTIATGVAGTGPAFSAYQSSSQTLTANTFTKVTYDTEEFDTNSNFASSRFTPTIAGYYQINASVQVNSSNTSVNVQLWKNSSAFKSVQYMAAVSIGGTSGSAIIYLNGTGDYVEVYAQIGTTQGLNPSSIYTYFQGTLARAL